MSGIALSDSVGKDILESLGIITDGCRSANIKIEVDQPIIVEATYYAKGDCYEPKYDKRAFTITEKNNENV